MEAADDNAQLPGVEAGPNMFEHFVQAIDRIAVGLSQQNAQLYHDFQEQLHAYQQQMQQHVAAPQQQREFRLEGVSMPTFSGKPTESVDEYVFRAKLFMQGKGINYNAPENQQRVVAILAANLRDGAASWYHTQVMVADVQYPDVQTFADALQREFVPPDQQFRLRAQLKACRQRGSIEDYVRDFRRLMAQIRDMSAMDQVDRFCEGLKSETKKEVMYLRCGTLIEAISAAQAFERTHFHGHSDRGRPSHAAARNQAQRSSTDGPVPMDVSVVDTRSISKEQCRLQRLCFYCKSSGHRIGQCPRRRTQQNGVQQGNELARRT